MAAAALSLLFLLSGCAVYQGKLAGRPTTKIPPDFSPSSESGIEVDRWWTSFEQPELNRLVGSVVANNLSLQQEWARLTQAQELVRVEDAEVVPAVSGKVSGNDNSSEGIPGDVQWRGGDGAFSQYVVGGSLSYEVDLWRRTASRRVSALRTAGAARENVEAMALKLVGKTVVLWIGLNEQMALRNLLRDQIGTSRTIEELLELRFSVNQATSFDIYQQRQLLAAVEAQLPVVEGSLLTLWYELQVLQAMPPTAPPSRAGTLPRIELPAFPSPGLPIGLVGKRPDLRASLLRLQAADADVATAVAERYPRLQFVFSYEFRTDSVAGIVDKEARNIMGNLLAPLIDGGRRRAVVRQRKAIVAERLAAFNSLFLLALQEVEGALAQERFQKELVAKRNAQRIAAETNFEETKSRYWSGISDYLSVAKALQSLRNAERELISVRADLLRNRVALYQALGGGWTSGLSPPLMMTSHQVLEDYSCE